MTNLFDRSSGVGRRFCVATFTILSVTAVAGAQTSRQVGTLAVTGQTGTAATMQMNGRTYIDLESLARLTGGSLRFEGTQTILTLPTSGATAEPAKAPTGFSHQFLNAGIDAMASVREWRAAIANAVQTSNPVSETWVGAYRRSADAQVLLAAASATTDSDKKAVPLLQNELSKMQALSSTYVGRQRNVQYTDANAFTNDPQEQALLACALGLSKMISNGSYDDVAACH